MNENIYEKILNIIKKHAGTHGDGGRTYQELHGSEFERVAEEITKEVLFYILTTNQTKKG